MRFEQRIELMLALLLLGVGPCCSWKLTLLHINNIQSTITPLSNDEGKEQQSFGGMSRLHRAVETFRKNKSEVLLLNAGDFFSGTWYQLFKWKIIADFNNLLRFDAMALGNHEFDDGLENLEDFLKNIKTNGTIPLAANLKIKDNSTNLSQMYENYRIIDNTQPNGYKIGIIGFMAKDAHQTSRVLNCNAEIEDEIEILKEQATILKKEKGVDLIIALGHSKKFKSLEDIATKVPFVNVVVGGGPKKLLYNKEHSYDSREMTYPIEIKNENNETVLIVTTHTKTKNLGNLELNFNKNGLVGWDGKLIPLNNRTDSEIKMVRKYINLAEDQNNTKEIINSSSYFRISFNEETELGNLVTDSMVWAYSKNNEAKDSKIELALLNSGTMTSPLKHGPINKRDIVALLPFGNTIEIINITGTELKTVFENSVDKFTEDGRNYGNDVGKFIQVSGFRLKYDLQNIAGERLISDEVKENGKFNKINSSKIYKVVINSYMKTLPVFKDKAGGLCKHKKHELDYYQLDAVLDYLAYLKKNGSNVLQTEDFLKKEDKRISFVPDCMAMKKYYLPTVMLLGPSGVGKSEVRKKLMPNRIHPPISEKKGYENKTMNYYIGNWLGTGECFVIIDTPGDCNKWGKQAEYWKKLVTMDFEKINAYLIILDGRKQLSLGHKTVQVINNYNKIFGHQELQSRMIFNVNWWRHNKCSRKERKKVNFQQVEMNKMIQKEAKNNGWKTNVTILYIDAMFDNNLLKEKNNEEANHFRNNTGKLWTFIQDPTPIFRGSRHATIFAQMSDKKIENKCETDRGQCNEEDYFLCDNGEYCINSNLLNNGFNDCNDNSDELITKDDIENNTVTIQREFIREDGQISLSALITIQMNVKEKKGLNNSCFTEIQKKEKKFHNISIENSTLLMKTEEMMVFRMKYPLHSLGKKVDISILGYSRAMERIGNNTFIDLANIGHNFKETNMSGKIDFNEWDCNENNESRVAIKLSRTCTDITLKTRCIAWKEGDATMEEILSHFCKGYQKEMYFTIAAVMYILFLLTLYLILTAKSPCKVNHFIENVGKLQPIRTCTHEKHLECTYMENLGFRLFQGKTFFKETILKSFFEVENKFHKTSEEHYQCINQTIRDKNFKKEYMGYTKRRQNNIKQIAEKQIMKNCCGYEIICTLPRIEKKEKNKHLSLTMGKKIMMLMTSPCFWNKFLFICLYLWDYTKDFSFIDNLVHFHYNIRTKSNEDGTYFNTSYPLFVSISILVLTQATTMCYMGLNMKSKSRFPILGNCNHLPPWQQTLRRIPLFLPAASIFFYFLEYCKLKMILKEIINSQETEEDYHKYINTRENINDVIECFNGIEVIEKVCETFCQFYLNIAILITVPTLVLTFSFGIPFEVLVVILSIISIFSIVKTLKRYQDGSEAIYISSTSGYNISKSVSFLLTTITKFGIYLICFLPFPTLFGISMLSQGLVCFIIFSFSNLFPSFRKASADVKFLHLIVCTIIPSPLPPTSHSLEKTTKTQIIICSVLFYAECVLNICFASSYQNTYNKIVKYFGLPEDFFVYILLILLTLSVCISMMLTYAAMEYYHPSKDNFRIAPPLAAISSLKTWQAKVRSKNQSTV